MTSNNSTIAAGPEPDQAAPTEGCYVGTGDSSIEYQVKVTRKLDS